MQSPKHKEAHDSIIPAARDAFMVAYEEIALGQRNCREWMHTHRVDQALLEFLADVPDNDSIAFAASALDWARPALPSLPRRLLTRGTGLLTTAFRPLPHTPTPVHADPRLIASPSTALLHRAGAQSRVPIARSV